MSIPEGYAKLAVIGIAWKGEYAADSVYHKMNGVCYEGSTYIALKDNPSGPPAHDGTNWQYLAKGFAEALMSACTATDTQGLVVEAGETTNAQTLMDSIADKVVTLDAPTFEDYTGDGATVPSAETALAALKSKIKLPVWMSNVVAFCKGCCTLAMIVDNCVTDNAGLPLSAAQGKALMDLINQTNSNLNEMSVIKPVNSEFLSSDIVINHNLYGFISNNAVHLNGWIEIPAGTYQAGTEIFKLRHTIGSRNTCLLASSSDYANNFLSFFINSGTNKVTIRHTVTLERKLSWYFFPLPIVI